MRPIEPLLQRLSDRPISILDTTIPLHKYSYIDLSTSNRELEKLDIFKPEVCQSYINAILQRNDAEVAYGGYLEKRAIYRDKTAFFTPGNGTRDIHLGLDFWAEAGTKVCAALDGMVHSFKNNKAEGDYGPTIILVHHFEGHTFHSLYGHLSLSSLNGLFVGKAFRAGEVLATLGEQHINGNYPPHLHFQLIVDMQGHIGDYPGVCTADQVPRYAKNCPDPNLLLNLQSK